MRYTAVGTASYGRLFLPITLSGKGRICGKFISSRRIKRDGRPLHLIKPNWERQGMKPEKRYKREVEDGKKRGNGIYEWRTGGWRRVRQKIKRGTGGVYLRAYKEE